MAERTGLEPATSGVTGRRSNQLNYRSNGFREENQTKPVSISPQPENQPDLAAIPLWRATCRLNRWQGWVYPRAVIP